MESDTRHNPGRFPSVFAAVVKNDQAGWDVRPGMALRLSCISHSAKWLPVISQLTPTERDLHRNPSRRRARARCCRRSLRELEILSPGGRGRRDHADPPMCRATHKALAAPGARGGTG